MNIQDIKVVTVLGAGNMGHQIAPLVAMNGFEVYCFDVSEKSTNRAQEFIRKYTTERVEAGKMSKDVADGTLKRLHFTNDLKEATKNTDFVIEAVSEDLGIKVELFPQLDELCPPHAILASNSSAFPSSMYATLVNRPEKICNMHFFNPALVIKVVEVVRGEHTSDETVQITMDLCKALGKTPVLLNKEIDGFVVNRILGALTKEACELVDKGICTPQDIDIAVEGALNHPMGPFRLMDLTGIDLYYILQRDYALETPPDFLREKFEAGHFGRKTGQGFYTYNKK